MFVKTQDNSIVNMDKVIFAQVGKYLNRDMGTLNLQMEGYCMEAYRGTIEEAEDAFNTLTEGLIHGATLIDYSKSDREW